MDAGVGKAFDVLCKMNEGVSGVEASRGVGRVGSPDTSGGWPGGRNTEKPESAS